MIGKFVLAVCLMFLSLSAVQAREIGDQYDMYQAPYAHAPANPHRQVHYVARQVAHRVAVAQPQSPAHISLPTLTVAGAIDRPADCYGIPWCGCYLKHILGLASSALNLNWAPNWRLVGTPLPGPQVGAVAGSSRHVALIVGPPDERGLWLIHDGNDGPVRIHRASLAWASFYRMP